MSPIHRRCLVAATMILIPYRVDAASAANPPTLGLLEQPCPAGFTGPNGHADLVGLSGRKVRVRLVYAQGIVSKADYTDQTDMPSLAQIVGSGAVCTRHVLEVHTSARWDCALPDGRRATYITSGLPGAYSGQAQLLP